MFVYAPARYWFSDVIPSDQNSKVALCYPTLVILLWARSYECFRSFLKNCNLFKPNIFDSPVINIPAYPSIISSEDVHVLLFTVSIQSGWLHCKDFIQLSFKMKNDNWCSSELAKLVLPSYSCSRSTGYPKRLLGFYVTIRFIDLIKMSMSAVFFLAQLKCGINCLQNTFPRLMM